MLGLRDGVRYRCRGYISCRTSSLLERNRALGNIFMVWRYSLEGSLTSRSRSNARFSVKNCSQGLIQAPLSGEELRRCRLNRAPSFQNRILTRRNRDRSSRPARLPTESLVGCRLQADLPLRRKRNHRQCIAISSWMIPLRIVVLDGRLGCAT